MGNYIINAHNSLSSSLRGLSKETQMIY